jgi:hypothetical protein
MINLLHACHITGCQYIYAVVWLFYRAVLQQCTNTGHLVAKVTNVCGVLPNVYGFSECNLLHVTLLVTAFLRWLLGIWKICAPLWYNVQGAQLFPQPQFISHSEPTCDLVTHTKAIICGKSRCSV